MVSACARLLADDLRWHRREDKGGNAIANAVVSYLGSFRTRRLF